MKKRIIIGSSIILTAIVLMLSIYINNTYAASTTISLIDELLNNQVQHEWAQEALADGLYENGFRPDNYIYIGANPNNWVRFNDDDYRIIGLFYAEELGFDSGYRVKLTRSRPIDSYARSILNTSNNSGKYLTGDVRASWVPYQDQSSPQNSYVLLNEYFYNRTEVSDVYGPCTDWAYSFSTDSNGFYSNVDGCHNLVKYGIKDEYRNYIEENANWPIINYVSYYNGEMSLIDIADCSYGACGYYLNNDENIAPIGMMNFSDYVFATRAYNEVEDFANVDLNTNPFYISYNWLSLSDEHLMDGEIGSNSYDDNSTVPTYLFSIPDSRNAFLRPTFYLKEGVYVKSGDGSIDNPYILGYGDMYTVKLLLNGSSYTVSIASYGENLTYNIDLGNGYYISSVTCTNNQNTSFDGNVVTIKNISSDDECNVVTKRMSYTVKASITPSSAGKLDATSKTVSKGNSGTFTVTPTAGYEINNVSCNNHTATFSGNKVTVKNVNQDDSCTIRMGLQEYTVTASVSPVEGGSLDVTSKTVTAGSNIDNDNMFVFTITPGYHLNNIVCTNGMTGDNGYYDGDRIYKIKVYGTNGITNDTSCTINVALNTYRVTAAATNGVVSTPTSQDIDHGGSLTFTVTPSTGYVYDSISCDVGTAAWKDNKLTITNVTKTGTCTVNFINQYTISTSISPSGSATVSPTSKTLKKGQASGTFTVYPETGYELSSVSCTNNQTASVSGNTFSIATVTGSTTCTINMTKKTYTVTAKVSPTSGATISGSASKSIEHGDTATFTVTPEVGYKYSSVTSGCSYNSATNTLTVSNVTAAKTCTVYFVAKTEPDNIVKNFPYSGSCETYPIEVTGYYKLEVWGAQGGSYSDAYTGGKGGYSYGTVYLSRGTNLYVCVGGQPTGVASAGGTNKGGFNGGGDGKTFSFSGTTTYAMGGGGATDIRIGSNNVNTRVIVAGGGSGSTNSNNGFAGGGTSGLGTSGYFGTATSAGTGGSFGQGASVSSGSSNYKYGAPGGGGGWYGGGRAASASDTDTSVRTKTGGGSGFVWTSATSSNKPSSYTLTSTYYLSYPNTLAGDQNFKSPTSDVTELGHSGNGYARISYLRDFETFLEGQSKGTGWSSGAEGLYKDENGDYRYVGANPNNWVRFNNDDYRIIGIFSNNTHGQSGKLIKLISANSMLSSAFGVYNTTKSSGKYGGYSYDWRGNNNTYNNLYLLYNEYFYNKKDSSTTYGSCKNWTYFDYGINLTTESCNNIIKYGINDEYRSYIQPSKWWLYGYASGSLSKQNWYLCEKGSYTGCTISVDSYITAPIGLMYPSDYMYASGYFSSTSTTDASSNYYAINNWLYNGSEYMMNPYLGTAKGVFSVSPTGSLMAYRGKAQVSRPTFYLRSDVKVSGGTGAYNDPYQLNM